MKLLSKDESRSKLKEQNDELVDKNIRLREYMKQATRKLNTIKDDYADDKLKRLRDFEQFCADIQKKKAVLLKELHQMEMLIESKKELYYGLIEKQDVLEEKLHQLNEKENKLKLREEYAEQIEQAITQKTNAYVQM